MVQAAWSVAGLNEVLLQVGEKKTILPMSGVVKLFQQLERSVAWLRLAAEQDEKLVPAAQELLADTDTLMKCIVQNAIDGTDGKFRTTMTFTNPADYTTNDSSSVQARVNALFADVSKTHNELLDFLKQQGLDSNLPMPEAWREPLLVLTGERPGRRLEYHFKVIEWNWKYWRDLPVAAPLAEVRLPAVGFGVDTVKIVP